MKILAISCSNVLHKQEDSISTRVCTLAEKILQQRQPGLLTETLRLGEVSLANCVFCGRCAETGRCARDPAFNAVYQKMVQSDALVLVIPFYSIVPSKLTMLLEKLNQVYYTAWIKDSQARFALSGKKIALIAHGGSVLRENPSAMTNYVELLLKPLNYSLQSLGFQLVGDGRVKGVAFGCEGYQQSEESLFPDLLQDWDEIESLIIPLLAGLAA